MLCVNMARMEFNVNMLMVLRRLVRGIYVVEHRGKCVRGSMR